MAAASRLRAGAHSFEGEPFTIVSFGPGGRPVAVPLVDEEGIVFGDISSEAGVEAKQMHDIVGHHDRFDVFERTVRGQAQVPITWATDEG
jgi:aliphatic nitrilase